MEHFLQKEVLCRDIHQNRPASVCVEAEGWPDKLLYHCSGKGGHFNDTNDLHIDLWRAYIFSGRDPGSHTDC